MSIVQERCPACSAPLPIIQPGVRRLQCGYCGSALSVERRGDTISVELAERVIGFIEQSGVQSQAEFRRLLLTQELSSAEMQLANLQSEMRAIQREPANAISRSQLNELQAKSIELRQQIAGLKGQLYPGSQPTPTPRPRPMDWRFTPQRIGWLLLSFDGRTNRLEFWVGALVFLVVYLVLVIVFAILGALPEGDGTSARAVAVILNFFVLVQTLLLIWIALAVSVKRYHDRNKPAWWVLLVLIPLVGAIFILVELGFFAGTPGPNRYG
jgi:uncharacterized membrane protein YhaH (DUF805 family)